MSEFYEFYLGYFASITNREIPMPAISQSFMVKYVGRNILEIM